MGRPARGAPKNYPGEEFRRRFLQHVLPRGVNNVRYDGGYGKRGVDRGPAYGARLADLGHPLVDTSAQLTRCRRRGRFLTISTGGALLPGCRIG